MGMTRRWLLLTIVLPIFAVGLPGCGDSNSARDPMVAETALPDRSAPAARPVAPPASAPSLPAPVGLSSGKSRQTRFVEGDLVKNGADFDLTLPHTLVTADGADNDFSPLPGGNGLPGCAYCIYKFTAPGYDRNAQLRADWSTAADDGGIFFGVANFDQNRWDWFHGSAEPKLNLPARSPYFSPADEMLVVVLCNGEAQRLTSLRIGSLPPVAILNLANRAAFVPVSVNLDASASNDPDGSIVKYEYDLDGNGSFELDGGTTANLPHDFEQAGFFPIMLRVRDDDGLTATISVPFTACAQWVHSIGLADNSVIFAVAYDGKGGIYAAGHAGDAGASDLLLFRYDLAGNLVWARSWESGNSESAADLRVSSSGNLVLTALCDADLGHGKTQNLLLQTWSPDGDLLLSRYFDNEDQIFPAALTVDGNLAYVCGVCSGFDALGLVVLNLDSGNIEFDKSWSLDAGTSFLEINDMTLTSQFVFGSGTARMAAVAGAIGLGGSSQAFVAQFDNSAVEDRLEIGDTLKLDLDTSSAGAVIRSGSIIAQTVVSGTYQDGTDQAFFVTNLKTTGTPNLTWSSGSSMGNVSGLTTRLDGEFCTIGNRTSGQGLALRFPVSGFGVDAETYSDPFFTTSFYSNLSSIAGICGVAGGECVALSDITVSAVNNTSANASLSWSPLSPGEIALDFSNVVDLPGTVDSAPAVIIDNSASVRQGLLVSRPL